MIAFVYDATTATASPAKEVLFSMNGSSDEPCRCHQTAGECKARWHTRQPEKKKEEPLGRNRHERRMMEKMRRKKDTELRLLTRRQMEYAQRQA